MKKFVTIFMIVLFAQTIHSQKPNNSYDSLWKSVEQFENQSLTKSAFKTVSGIISKAKKDKNNPQLVKALIYASKYALILEEDAQLHIINNFKSEIKKAEFPTKNILESYLASMYYQYFNQNQYQFLNRTKTETKVDNVDFRTWDLTTLFHEINLHFENSLTNSSELKKVKISDYNSILHQQKNSILYRPTLFDLLSHTALAYYKNPVNGITRPADKFEIENTNLLADANTFSKVNIFTKDKTSSQARALLTYQELTKFHINNSDKSALVEIDIERLKYVYQNAIFNTKKEHYLDALQNAESTFKGNELSALYSYEIGLFYQQLGNTYSPKKNTEHRNKIKEALEICKKVNSLFPKSIGAKKCNVLAEDIKTKDLNISAEKNIPVNKPSRLLVEYKNINKLNLVVYSVSQKEINKLHHLYEQDKILNFIKKLPSVKSWSTSVTNENDFQQHKTEILLPKLANGSYVILASPNENQKSSFGFAIIQVTSFALVKTRTQTHQNFQIIHRNNGNPITNAKVKIRYKKDYNAPFVSSTYNTNEKGIVKIPLPKTRWQDVDIEVHKNNELAHFNNLYIYQHHQNNEDSKIDYQAFLFTDRSIYRPGQPLHFKGILLEKNDNRSKVLEKEKVTVTLYDANRQVAKEAQFISNDYGSFSGEFIIPNNGLTGLYSMRIRSEKITNHYGDYINVEEYKRPKFETLFNPVTESYKVNDSITVTGMAKAYAGSNITDAKVTYTVQRNTQYPRWYYWSHYYPPTTTQVITNGETKTDDAGNYSINFKAIPDNTSDRNNLPTFQYIITAAVTDINGETHETTTTVYVGYHAINANIYVKNPVNKREKEQYITVTTVNLNSQPIPAKGNLKIYKLQAPESVLRQRPWAAPDYKGWSKQEFKKLFPNDAYEDEHLPKNWKKGKLVQESAFNTEETTQIELKNIKKWESGIYTAELKTKDKFGNQVKDIIQFTVQSDKDKKLADNQLFHIQLDKDTYNVGDNAEVTFFSNSNNLTVTLFIEKNNQKVESRILHLNENCQSINIPITETDLGGIALSYSYAAYNSYASGKERLNIPFPSTQLQIETSTFRNKMQPGTDETWAFKIKGPQGDKVTAEILASMYDTSLDQFTSHHWGFQPISQPYFYGTISTDAHNSFGIESFRMHTQFNNRLYYENQSFDSFNWFGLYFGQNRHRGLYSKKVMRTAAVTSVPEEAMEMEADMGSLDEIVTVESGEAQKEGVPGSIETSKNVSTSYNVQIRKNLQETAFFFPHLQTDKEGNVSFSFTTPEALTKWKLQLLAYTKNLESATTTLESITQKELMVTPNVPRFLREGDAITISTKIANLTNNVLSGKATLKLTDVLSNKDVTSSIITSEINQTFKVDSAGNTQVSWKLEIPEGLQAVQYTIIAKAGDYSDGEQNVLPVLTNRMLVTETLPMWIRGNQTKTFRLNKLKNNKSTTLTHHKLSLEITSNPAWYAIQALPYLMEYPYDCNEQIFSKYYANTLASYIANANPRIQNVFNQWASSTGSVTALISNLEKNQELKSILIQETPWLRDAQSETEQKKRIALLFNLNKMKNEQMHAIHKLEKNQLSSGAWSWFKGGRENRFITQHIAIGFGHLNKISTSHNLVSSSINGKIKDNQMLKKAIAYLDEQFISEYERMKKYSSDINKDHLSHTQLHYLYMRSFFTEIPTSKKVEKISNYYLGQAQKYWTSRNLYSKGLIALTLFRNNNTKTAFKVIRALKENSITSQELGMYWKENENSWYWHQAPIETQSLLIEAFSEIENDPKTIDNLKIWLLKNKQTNQWKTTKATTNAIYALLLKGSDWLSVSDAVDVQIGGKTIDSSILEDVKIEAGTGYYKTSWKKTEIKPEMAEVTLTKKGKGIAWGALYWQYFENLDKITSAETPLRLSKKLFIKRNTATGEVLSEISEETTVKVGDLVRIRIELKADRPMEFVHMKDMRAAGFEPTSVLSKYKWQDGLGYYESTKDASTNFFFDYLPKGIFVFEYDLRVNNAGNFSNGITTIQSMYAPEFSSHSEGITVSIKN